LVCCRIVRYYELYHVTEKLVPSGTDSPDGKALVAPVLVTIVIS